MNAFQKLLLETLVSVIMQMMTPEKIKIFARGLVDYARNHVLGTETKVDDKFVLPLLDRIVEAFGLDEEG